MLNRCLPFGLLLSLAGVLCARDGGEPFRVLPYLQNPTSDGMTIIWFSDCSAPGTVTIDMPLGPCTLASKVAIAEGLSYSVAERKAFPELRNRPVPFEHRVRVTGLRPGTVYRYTVSQEKSIFRGSLKTAPLKSCAIRFVVYADCETEPESRGKRTLWEDPPDDNDRLYPADQTTGYAENLKIIESRNPDFVAIAGDLVETGGSQRDWDEFWRHNAGDLGGLASQVPLFPALGNHENYAPELGQGGYDPSASAQAVRKFKTYFEAELNGAENYGHEGRYYSVTYGPVTLITLDSSNGLPDSSERDTNFHLSLRDEGADTENPPDFNPGSRQYEWLEDQLAKAQRKSRFTFVQFHHAPYSSGPHGAIPGPPGGPHGTDPQSGRPLRVLTPLFLKYGVDAVFSGHGEIYEHSVLRGEEKELEGRETEHEIHFYDVGIGGDGLRCPKLVKRGRFGASNPHQVFLAFTHAPEVWQGKQLISGGRHYGHLEIDVSRDESGSWICEIEPAYAFPLMNQGGEITSWERRVYDDVVKLPSLNRERPWNLGRIMDLAFLVVIILGALVWWVKARKGARARETLDLR